MGRDQALVVCCKYSVPPVEGKKKMPSKIAKNIKPTNKQRKPYHPPHLTDYGAVNALTRSGSFFDPDDSTANRLYDGLAPNY